MKLYWRIWVLSTLLYPFIVFKDRRTKYPGTGKCYHEMCVYTPTQVRVHRYFVKGSVSGKYNHLSHMDKLILNIFPGVSGTNWLFFLPFTCRVQLCLKCWTMWLVQEQYLFSQQFCTPKWCSFSFPARATLTIGIFCCTFFLPLGTWCTSSFQDSSATQQMIIFRSLWKQNLFSGMDFISLQFQSACIASSAKQVLQQQTKMWKHQAQHC